LKRVADTKVFTTGLSSCRQLHSKHHLSMRRGVLKAKLSLCFQLSTHAMKAYWG